MKKIEVALISAILFSIFVISSVFAQTGELTLKMSRDWGYGGFNGDIQGLFSMHVSGPADLARVDYYIDAIKIGEVSKPPFTLQFSTDNYSLGVHQLYAVGYSSNGQVYRSNIVPATFVTKQSETNVIFPILAVVLIAILLSALVPFLAGRGKHLNTPLGAERHYGPGGGGICPKCHRPFALPLFSAHLGFSKLAICPYCKKWNLVRVESIDKLRAAEQAELEQAKSETPVEIPDTDKLSKEIDDSKYQGF